MRTYLKESLESHNDTSYGVLSMEEEQQLLTEAAADEASVTADLGEVARMNDISEAIEDLAVIADGIEDPTDAEAALVDNVAQMAVTGTEVAPDEIVPALESHAGKRRISTEGLRETARNIWEAIKRVMKKIWEKIESFFYKIFGTIPGLRRSIKSLKEKVDNNSSRTQDAKKIAVNVGVASLSVNYVTPKSEGDLKSAMSTMLTMSEFLYGKNVDTTISMGEDIVTGLNDFDAAKPQESLKGFAKKIVGHRKELDKLPNSGSLPSGRWPGFDGSFSAPLPGNISIVARYPTDVEKRSDDASINYLEKLRRITTEVVQTSEKSKDVPNTFEMSTMSNNAMNSVLDDAEKLLDVLEKFQRGKRYADMKKVRGKLETASEKASKSVAKLSESEEASEKDAVPYYRAMVNFNQSYGKWVKDPAMPMVTHSLAFVRGVMACVQKSLAAYK